MCDFVVLLLIRLKIIYSGVENENEIYSCGQLEAVQSDKPIVKEELKSENNNNFIQTIQSVKIKPLQHRPKSVTASIFTKLPDKQQSAGQSIPQQKAYSVTAKLFSPISAIVPRAQPVTSKLFVPRTEDMNKGFFMFPEEEPGLASKYKFLFCFYLKVVNVVNSCKK